MSNGPKDFYEWGICFLRAHPKLASWHERAKKVIMRSITKETLAQFCQKQKNVSKEAIKQKIVLCFSLATFFAFITILQFLSDFSLFGLLFDGILTLIPYYIGVMNTEALKNKGLPMNEETISVMPVAVQPKKVKPVAQKAPEKEVKKKEITPFWRLFGIIEMLCTLGWVYFSLAWPEALKQWLNQNGLMDFIPHEFGSINQLNETALLIGGIVVLPIAFTLLRGALKILFWIFKRMSPKREIREI